MKKENPKDHIALLYHMARKYNAGPGVSVDEVVSWGYEGLHNACINYNSERGGFGNYAPLVIKTSIRRWHKKSKNRLRFEPDGVIHCQLKEAKDSHVEIQRENELLKITKKIFKYVKTLGSKNYKIFCMRFVDDMTFQQIADEFGTRKQAAQYRIKLIQKKIIDRYSFSYANCI